MTGGFPSERASNADNISIWWRHNDTTMNIIRCSAVITLSVCSKLYTKSTNGRAIECLLWIQHLLDILPEFLESFMHYLTILDRVVPILDCIYLFDKRVVSNWIGLRMNCDFVSSYSGKLYVLDLCRHNGPLTRYVKLWVAHALGVPGTFSIPPTSTETAS